MSFLRAFVTVGSYTTVMIHTFTPRNTTIVSSAVSAIRSTLPARYDLVFFPCYGIQPCHGEIFRQDIMPVVSKMLGFHFLLSQKSCALVAVIHGNRRNPDCNIAAYNSSIGWKLTK
jgi:hypothetical protein